MEILQQIYGCFLKWWYPTTMGFPTKNDHFVVFWGVPPFKETPIWRGRIQVWAFCFEGFNSAGIHTIHGTGLYIYRAYEWLSFFGKR